MVCCSSHRFSRHAPAAAEGDPSEDLYDSLRDASGYRGTTGANQLTERTRAAVVFSIQSWLGESEETKRKASTPGYFSVGMACS
jgi:hypothetical protein